MKLSGRALAITAAAGAGMQVGAAIVATRAVVQDVGPFLLAFLRYAIALACLLPFSLSALKEIPPIGTLTPLLLLGVLQFGLLMALLNVGLLFLPASLGAIIFSSLPLVTLLLAWAFGYEAIAASTLCAIALVMAGVCLAVGHTPFREQDLQLLLGTAAVAAATLCGAISTILYRVHSVGAPFIIVILAGLAAAVAFLLPLTLFEMQARNFALPSAHLMPLVLFIGVSSVAGFYLWIFALTRASATSVAIGLASAPISAAALGMFLLSEPLDQGTVLGLACVVAAYFLLCRQPVTKEGQQ